VLRDDNQQIIVVHPGMPRQPGSSLGRVVVVTIRNEIQQSDASVAEAIGVTARLEYFPTPNAYTPAMMQPTPVIIESAQWLKAGAVANLVPVAHDHVVFYSELD